MNQNELKEYVELESQIKELEARKTTLRGSILTSLQENKLEKIESEYGKFTVVNKTTWKYSEVVEKLTEKLKITKAKEEKKGVAKASVSQYLLFTKPTSDGDAVQE